MSGTKIALAQPHSFQSGALSFISCTSARESSPLDENDSLQPTEFKAETKKKRFHPLRNLRRMFRRKNRRSSTSVDSYPVNIPDNSEIPGANLEHRSCSTSRLQEENVSHSLIKNNRLNPGLSLSHDSIFTPDRTDSGLSSSDLENSSLSITVLTPPSREFTMKSQSSCSETSLLSLGSSEVELSPSKNGKLSDLDLGVATYKLSHSAAKHKMAVKPKRNHGAPRNRRKTLTSKSPLPTTVEVSEEGQSFSLEFTSSSPPKTNWNEVIIEATCSDQDAKVNEVFNEDEEVDGKEEENESQKQESFFGRFFYRKSEKKKKIIRESNNEEVVPLEDKCNQTQKKVFRSVGKTPNQRQRVEPVEIPVSPLMGTNAFRGQRDGKNVISSSVSPPKNNWPSQVLSRSISPPKVIWPENFPSPTKKSTEEPFIWDQPKPPQISPTKNVPTDLKNSDFMKELTNSVMLFGKDEIGKRKKDEEDEDIVLKIRRQHSENETPRQIKNLKENSQVELKKSDLADEISLVDKDIAKEEPPKVKCRSPFNHNPAHDDYENIQIIEVVKKEIQKKLVDEPMEVEKKEENKVIVEKPIITDFIRKETEKLVSSEKAAEEQEKMKADSEKVVKEMGVEIDFKKVIKPVFSEKPKDLRKTGAFESAKIDSNKMEMKPTTSDEVKVLPRTRSTLVERRKSELFLLTETEEKNWKEKISPVKKQASFKETILERRSFHEGLIDIRVEEVPKKTEPVSAEPIMEDVILRKKCTVVRHSDEQPELMKVFARRSLKVKESEKLGEEFQKLRDSASDKENEVVDSVKERKISLGSEDKKDEDGEKEGGQICDKGKPPIEVKINITPLKPEVMSRKGVLHRYGRRLSEVNAKKEDDTELKSFVLDESKIRNSLGTIKKEEKEEKKEEEEKEEGGFKRIQQRKAEWERRAQQSAK